MFLWSLDIFMVCSDVFEDARLAGSLLLASLLICRDGFPSFFEVMCHRRLLLKVLISLVRLTRD